MGMIFNYDKLKFTIPTEYVIGDLKFIVLLFSIPTRIHSFLRDN